MCLLPGLQRKVHSTYCKNEQVLERQVYLHKVNGVGRSHIKKAVANQITECMPLHSPVDRSKTVICVENAFRGGWELVDEKARDVLKRILPSNPAKGSVRYHMQKKPSDYMAATRCTLETKLSKFSSKTNDEETCSRCFRNIKLVTCSGALQFLECFQTQMCIYCT